MKRIRFVPFILIAAILLSGVSAFAVSDAELASAAEKGVEYYRQNGYSTWWEYFALIGLDCDAVLPQLDEQEILGEDVYTATYAARAIAFMANGEDPRSYYEDVDLIERISESCHPESFTAPINNQVYAILALDEHYRPFYDRCTALNNLISQQYEDGSFGYGAQGDLDLTAMALLALSRFGEAEGSIDKAVEYLKENRDENGAYISPWTGEENTCTLAAVISGLVAAGVDLSADGWDKSVDKLLSYQLENGAFEDGSGNGVTDYFSTYQALLAIGDMLNGSIYNRYAADFEAAIFSDIDDVSDWAADYVDRAIRLGLTPVAPDNLLNPGEDLTRGEFAWIAARSVIDLVRHEPMIFSDVDESSWYYQEVQRVSAQGIMVGYDGFFHPEESISRQDAAVVIYRMIRENGLFDEVEYERLSDSDFNDFDQVSDYARESVLAVASVGIMEGFDGMFRPFDGVTKEEFLKITMELINLSNEK